MKIITSADAKFASAVFMLNLDGQFKAISLNERVNIAPKQWLLDYILTDDFSITTQAVAD